MTLYYNRLRDDNEIRLNSHLKKYVHKLGTFQLEKAFSDPRDIEWAVCGDQIYLLQVRLYLTVW